jgi:ABC-2 type transport system ATP-binding protein
MNDNPTVPPPLDLAFDVQGLWYSYGQHHALQGVTFSVTRRSIHGFVGPNGAGKTTALKVLSTLMKPQTGQVRVCGLNVVADYKQVRRRVGFMPDHFSVYRQMTVFEYLDFFGAAYGMGQAERDKVIADVLALTDMHGRRDDLLKGLSRGMQQRVSLARVLVHDPELLLLDEPASGLDPRARIELMEILQELRRLGKTIFISSHILSELATLCDHVTILDQGKVKYTGTMRGLVAYDGADAQYVLTLAAEHPPVEEALRALEGVSQVSKSNGDARYLVAFSRERVPVNLILQTAIQSGGQIMAFQEDVKHLNQAFMDLTTPGVRT